MIQFEGSRLFTGKYSIAFEYEIRDVKKYKSWSFCWRFLSPTALYNSEEIIMSYGIIHLTCLCGRTFDINDESSVSCQCGNVINGKSLQFNILPASHNVRLVEYRDTKHHDNDLLGTIVNDDHTKPVYRYHTKPVYRGFAFSYEYGEGRFDECDCYIVATKLSDPHIRFTVFNSGDSYKRLLKQVDIYQSGLG